MHTLQCLHYFSPSPKINMQKAGRDIWKIFLVTHNYLKVGKKPWHLENSLYPTRIRAVFDKSTKDGLTHLQRGSIGTALYTDHTQVYIHLVKFNSAWKSIFPKMFTHYYLPHILKFHYFCHSFSDKTISLKKKST